MTYTLHADEFGQTAEVAHAVSVLVVKFTL